MSFNGTNVVHLELSDFQNNVLMYKGRPAQGVWIVMVQGNFCHFCKENKKDMYIPVARQRGTQQLGKGPVFATIQVEEQQELQRLLPKIAKTNISGVPAYLRFENGNFTAIVVGKQTEMELVEFINQ